MIRGLACFDLDGTLLRRPTICEMLAEPLGRSDEMVRIEALSDETAIAEARAEMVGWYVGVPQDELRHHVSTPNWAPGAREAVAQLQREGVQVAIASYTWKFAVELVAGPLDVAHYVGSEFGADGSIRHVWAKDKADWFAQLGTSYGLSRDRMAAVGDSKGDVEMLNVAGVRVCVGAERLPVHDVIHMPDADLRRVAELILGRWPA